MAQDTSPASHRKEAAVGAAFVVPTSSPATLKKRALLADHWHAPLEHSQQHNHGHEPQHQSNHHHHRHHHRRLGPGHHIRKKHVTESMAIDFELLTLESGHLPLLPLGNARGLQKECEAPSSSLSSAESSPTQQAPYDDTKSRAGFRSDANDELVSARATLQSIHEANSADCHTNNTLAHNSPPYQHPDCINRKAPLMPLAEEKGKGVSMISSISYGASLSDPKSLSTEEVHSLHDFDQEMKMDMMGNEELLHDHTETSSNWHTGNSGHGTLWRDHAVERHGGGGTRNHSSHVSGASSSSTHSRGYQVKANHSNMRQRKWNSVTKSWQEWRDVPTLPTTDRLVSYPTLGTSGQAERISCQGSQDAEISDSEFSDIEDLGVQRPITIQGRHQHRTFSAIIDHREMKGNGRTIRNNMASGKSTEPKGDTNSLGYNSSPAHGHATGQLDTIELNALHSTSLERPRSPHFTLNRCHTLPRLEHSPPPHATASNVKEAESVTGAPGPSVMFNTRMRSLSETYVHHHPHHSYNNNYHHHLYHNNSHSHLNNQSQWSIPEASGTDFSATSPISRFLVHRTGESSTVAREDPLAWQNSSSSDVPTGMDVIDELTAPVPGTDNQPSRESHMELATRGAVMSTNRRPRSPTDYFSSRPSSPRHVGFIHQYHLQRLSQHIHLSSQQHDRESWMSMGRDSMLHEDLYTSSTTSSCGTSGGSNGGSSGELSRSPSFTGHSRTYSPSTVTIAAAIDSAAATGSPSKQPHLWSSHNLGDLTEQTEGDSMDLEL